MQCQNFFIWINNDIQIRGTKFNIHKFLPAASKLIPIASNEELKQCTRGYFLLITHAQKPQVRILDLKKCDFDPTLENKMKL